MNRDKTRAFLAALGTKHEAALALNVGFHTIERWWSQGTGPRIDRLLRAEGHLPVTIRHETPVDHTAIVADDVA